MKFKKILLIVNPKSGKGKSYKQKDKIFDILKDHGEVITYLTKGKKDIENINVSVIFL